MALGIGRRQTTQDGDGGGDVEFVQPYRLEAPRIDSAALGLCYDSSHGRMYEATPFALLRQYPTRLYALHLSDNDGVEDRHWEIGKGLIDWDGFAAAFPAGLYHGRLSLEIIQDDAGEDEAHFLHRARQRIDALGAQLPAPPAAGLDGR